MNFPINQNQIEDKDKKFISNITVDNFLTELKQEKEKFDIPELDSDQLQTNNTQDDIKNNNEPVNDAKTAKAAAKFLVTSIDSIFASIAAFIALEDSNEKFKSDPDEKNDLIEAWFEYLKATDFNIPPWLMLLVLNIIIYSAKIPSVRTIYKQNKAVLDNLKEKEIKTGQPKEEKEPLNTEK